MEHRPSPTSSRPARWRRSLVAAGTALAVTLAGCASNENEEAAHSETVSAYLPTYAGDADLARVADQPGLLDSLDSVSIAFATPDAEGGVEAPQLSAQYIATIGKVAAGTEVLLAVGGYSIGNDRGAMKHNLHQALDDPEHFADAVITARDDVARQLGRTADSIGISLDLEWPAADEADEVTTVVRTLHARQPGMPLTMAIPVGHNQAGFNLPELVPFVKNFELMTYDYSVVNPLGTGTAGAIAPQDRVVQDTNELIDTIGDAAKVTPGFPAYANRYMGAQALGTPYDNRHDTQPAQILLKDIVQDQLDADGVTTVDGALVSAVSPDMARRTMDQLRNDHPAIAGGFIWQLTGATPELITAVRGK